MNRRIGSVLLAAFVFAGAGLAEDKVVVTAAHDIDDDVDFAIRNAVDYLVSRQKGDGRIADNSNDTTMTSLAILAMCSAGHVPTDDTREGETLRKALEFVLGDDRQDENGYFGTRDSSRMYGHGIISVMLAELLGMGMDTNQDRRIRHRLTRAIRLILRAQEEKAMQSNTRDYGGWRYEPNATDADLSVTIWQLVALRAAKNAGLDVPKGAIDKAIAYLRRCYRSDRDKDGNVLNKRSACAYQPGGSPNYVSASYGLLALQICGEYESQEVKGSADWLLTRRLAYDANFFFYGTYYYSQGMYQRGDKYAKHATKHVESILVENQTTEGYWDAASGQERDAGRVYTTSMAVLSLAVRYHYLPIYQR